jgi:hypothetical protein
MMPPDYRAALLHAVTHLGDSLRSAARRSLKRRACMGLRVVDAEGVESVHPYTPDAIATLEQCFGDDGSDANTIHHLAIAYHALAWDQEIAGDPSSQSSWEKALFYWRKLEACGPFWQDLELKGRALSAGFRPEDAAALRSRLSQLLLEVHTDFIWHYHALGEVEAAERQIALVARAPISPAKRNQLGALVYETKHAAIRQLAAESRFTDALSILAAILEMFPRLAPALQHAVEIGRHCVDHLPPEGRLGALSTLDAQLQPLWKDLRALEPSPDRTEPLADLAIELGKGWWTAGKMLLFRQAGDGASDTRDLPIVLQACTSAVDWLERALSLRPGSVPVQEELLWVLVNRARLTAELAPRDASSLAQALTRAITDCDRAIELGPSESRPHEVRKEVAGLLEAVRTYGGA